MKQAYTRRGALKATALAVPILAEAPAAAQTSAETELAAAEQRLNAAIKELHDYPLAADSESALVFRP